MDVQNEIENLTKTFENSTFISSPLYTESWVRSFVNYVNRNQEELNVTIDTRETFLQTLNDVRIEHFRIIYYNVRLKGTSFCFCTILAVAVQTESIFVGC